MERTLTLSPATWQALTQIATQENVPVDTVIAEAIRRDLFRRTRAKKAVRTDERLVAPLRALLASDFAQAETWEDLHLRLRAKGYTLVEAGAGLALCDAQSGQRVCKASDLGNSYGRLMQRFGCTMPGHSHTYLAPRMGVSLASSR